MPRLDPVKLLGMFRGVNHGGWDPADHNFHLYTIVIGSQTLHAVGYAMGVQRDGADAATIVYFGDGASAQGDVNEAFIWASVFNAPVVFFCQNNQWAISQPMERQTKIPLYRRASGFGFPGVRVDGNDVFACLAVTRKALRNAREGQGPTLIEAYTYRMGAHTTSDDPTRYRLADELEAWKLKDPIERVKAYLFKNQLADQEFFDKIDEEADALGKDVRAVSGHARSEAGGDLPARLRGAARPHGRGTRAVPDLPCGLRGRRRAMTTLTLGKALNEGMRRAMESDPKVLVMGEDVGKLGGVFRVTDGLQKDFGEDRVIDTPLAESGIIGTAIGLAMRGYRPSVRSSSTGSCSRRPTRSSRNSRRCRCVRWARSSCPSSSAFPVAAGSAPSSTTPSPRRRTSRTPADCGWSPARTRWTPTR